MTIFFSIEASALAALEESSPLHWSGDKTLWNRKTNKVELIGHGAIHQIDETITADHIYLDLTTRVVDAVGKCVYIAQGTVIHADEMHFNLDTRTGTIIGGRISSDRFSLTGDRINKLNDTQFQAHRGEYTTCLDCPTSWSLRGEDVDLEVGGYAYMTNVMTKVKDAPVFWLPYMIIPIKSQRQTGFLFPHFGLAQDGFRFVLPFFWATGRSTDMTIGVGEYGSQQRLEWEGRYKLSQRSAGIANFYFLHDTTFYNFASSEGFNATPKRYGLQVGQVQEFPFGIDEKLHLIDTSDSYYPTQIGDIPGVNEAYLASDLIFSHSTNQVSSYVAARRFRNLLDPDPFEFDPKTVQSFPAALVTTKDKKLFDLPAPVNARFTVGAHNFTRPFTPFDQDPISRETFMNPLVMPGVDPLRKATRFSVTPSLYTTIRPWDVVSIVPSVEYRGYYYSFHNEAPDLSRGYLLTQVDLSTQLEKIYSTEDEDIPRVKHLFRPLLTYSLIPSHHESNPNHPFLQQINYARENNFSGYNFDDNDIVPIDTTQQYTNYFLPLGNSLAYGFTTQIIRRRGSMTTLMPGYQTSVEFRTGQSFNFRELKKPPSERQPLSRYFALLALGFDHFSGSVDYTYVPYIPITDTQKRHVVSTSATYIIEKSTHQRILAFERSFTLSYAYNSIGSQTSNMQGGINYSISDYLAPRTAFSYDFVSKRWLNLMGGLRFQSPSQCWTFDVGGSVYACPKMRPTDTGVCYSYTADLSLNWTGAGFGVADNSKSLSTANGSIPQ